MNDIKEMYRAEDSTLHESMTKGYVVEKNNKQHFFEYQEDVIVFVMNSENNLYIPSKITLDGQKFTRSITDKIEVSYTRDDYDFDFKIIDNELILQSVTMWNRCSELFEKLDVDFLIGKTLKEVQDTIFTIDDGFIYLETIDTYSTDIIKLCIEVALKDSVADALEIEKVLLQSDKTKVQDMFKLFKEDLYKFRSLQNLFESNEIKQMMKEV